MQDPDISVLSELCTGCLHVKTCCHQNIREYNILRTHIYMRAYKAIIVSGRSDKFNSNNVPPVSERHPILIELFSLGRHIWVSANGRRKE